MEIVNGLHRIRTILGNRVLYQHLFVGDRIIIIDTGIQETPEAHIFPYLEKLGRAPSEIDIVIISHADADHFGGNETIRKAAPKAWIASHEYDARWIADPDLIMEERYNQFAVDHGMSYSEEVRTFLRNMMGGPIPVDFLLKGSERILMSEGRSLQIISLPGHTRGHIGVYDALERTAVFTDAILWRGLPDLEGRVVMPPTYCHTESYRSTIQMIEHLDIDILCFSHYEQLEGKTTIADFIAESRRFVERTDQLILEFLNSSTWRSLKDIISHAAPIIGPFGDAKDELAYPILGHLSEFTQQGRIETRRKDEIIQWRCA